MSDKRYPTRMHEALGVETGEVFDCEGRTWTISESGVLSIVNKRPGCYEVVGPSAVCLMINHPERITRRPRLTEEQVRKLKALYDFGMRWMFFTHSTAQNPWLYATTNKPLYTEPDWDGQGGWSLNGERLRIKGSPLNDLECVLADAPLDIVQVLRQNGEEVEG